MGGGGGGGGGGEGGRTGVEGCYAFIQGKIFFYIDDLFEMKKKKKKKKKSNTYQTLYIFYFHDNVIISEMQK